MLVNLKRTYLLYLMPRVLGTATYILAESNKSYGLSKLYESYITDRGTKFTLEEAGARCHSNASCKFF